MNKKVIFFSVTFGVCFVIGIYMNTLQYKTIHPLIHGRLLKDKLVKGFRDFMNPNRTLLADEVKISLNDNTTHFNNSKTRFQKVVHHVLQTLRGMVYTTKIKKGSENGNETQSSGLKTGDVDKTNLNISQAEFEISQEVLRSLEGEYDEKKLREKAEKVNLTSGRKVVMMYTPFFGNQNWLVEKEDFNTIQGTKCPFYQCDFTTDKKQFTRSDAVIFHARDMTGLEELKSLQKRKPAHQRWVYFIMENPINTPNPSPYNGMFNWTLTYRPDSDLRFPYGNYFPRITPWTEQESLKEFVQSKTKLIFWAASHCGLLRDKYIRKLTKYLKVDTFGACGAALGGGSESCPRKSKDCTEKLKKYKFALAFENYMCEDYITEKYWSKLFIGVVPVVMGGAKYDSKIAVPGSFINAADFPTVQALANYLSYLDKNNTAYMGFFNWRKKYIARDTLFYFKCALCAKINLDQTPKVYERLDETWSKKHCGTTDKIYNDIINRS